MQEIDNKIKEFIQEHHVMTLCTCADSHPYCCNAFYAYLAEENILVFTSDNNTRHVAEARANNKVSASIVLETNIVGKIQGLQILGIMFEPENELKHKANIKYLKRFPFAVLMNTQLWCLQMTYLKMTDNRLGFGKKIIQEL